MATFYVTEFGGVGSAKDRKNVPAWKEPALNTQTLTPTGTATSITLGTDTYGVTMTTDVGSHFIFNGTATVGDEPLWANERVDRTVRPGEELSVILQS